MPEDMTILPIEKTYTLLKTCLDNKGYPSTYPKIDKTTQSKTIAQFIDEFNSSRETPETLDSNAFPSIDDLYKLLSEIVYVSTLSFFYVSNTNKVVLSLNAKKLIILSELSNIQHINFRNKLQLAIKNSVARNEALETLTENYIKYLKSVKNAAVSSISNIAGKLIRIDFTEIKTEAKKKCSDLTKLLDDYRNEREEKIDEFFDAEEGNFREKEEEVEDEGEDEFFDSEEVLEKSKGEGDDLSEEIKKEKVEIGVEVKEQNIPQSKSIFFWFIEFIKKLFNHKSYEPSPSPPNLLNERSASLLSSSVVQCPANNSSLPVNDDEQPTWKKRLTHSTVSGNEHALFSNSASASNPATLQKANSNSDNSCWKKYINTRFI